MRKVHYIRTEFHAPDEEICQSLEYFILDLPYFIEHGVIPSFEVINQVLQTGGGNNGMSPGAIWESFTIKIQEYDHLVETLCKMDIDVEHESGKFRFHPGNLILDSDIQQIKNHSDYMAASRKKHFGTSKDKLDLF